MTPFPITWTPAALPAAGASAVWKYKAIYRFHDEQVGHWSDVVSISVMGSNMKPISPFRSAAWQMMKSKALFLTPMRVALACVSALLPLSVAFGQLQYGPLKSFGFPEQTGAGPTSIIKGSDGALYGTTDRGGIRNAGTVFKLNEDGSGYTVLHHFTGTDGRELLAQLVEGSDGALYGTTFYGGSSDLGVVFALRKDGSGYRVLHNFTGANGDGSYPTDVGVIEGGDGFLYGTTQSGGTSQFGGQGTVFRIKKEGSSYSVLHRFSAMEPEQGMWPRAQVVQASDGALYGTTSSGGIWGTNSSGGTVLAGTVFKLNPNGSGYTVLHSFGTTNDDGLYPEAALTEGSDGALYGTTTEGGTNGAGTVFRLSKDGTGHKVLHSFTGTNEGTGFVGHGLLEGPDGCLYGISGGGGAHDCGTLFKLNKDGSTFTVLYQFTTNGCAPSGSVVLGANAFYGVTVGGGQYRSGTVFKVNPSGIGFQVLRDFIDNSRDTEGHNPAAKLIEGSDGVLYGTTLNGGASVLSFDSCGGPCGWGSVFKINRDGSGYSLLHSFSNMAGDGAQPPASLIEGSDGVLYGTTETGGTNNSGTVYKLNQNGDSYAVLHRFSETSAEGRYPSAGLVEGTDGVLYGTAYGGGINDYGTVFKLNKDGTDFAVLHNFTGTDGRGPLAQLVEGSDGILYGTTKDGGAVNWGTVFELNKDGSGFTVLHDFGTTVGDGAQPYGAVLASSDGALYGTTYYGGARGAGTVFRLNRDGSSYIVLRSFMGTAGDGAYPSAALVQVGDGTLYGTTREGGTTDYGTVFKLNTNGSGYTVVHRFTGYSARDGSIPSAALLKARDGALYGTTFYGGDMDFGMIFVLRPPAPRLALAAMQPNGQFRFTLVGQPGSTYTIQASTNLLNWTELTNFVSATGTNQFTDPTAPNLNWRFYRAVTQ